MSGTSERPPRDAGEDTTPPPWLPDSGTWDGEYPDAGYDANDGAAAACLAVCPDAGGSCDGGRCVFTCANGACVGSAVRCPAAVPCEVDCLEGGACDKEVECNAAGACNVRCLAQGTCKELVTCAGPACAVECSGAASCTKGVSCDAGSCELRCTGDNACKGGATGPVACAGSSCAITCGVGDGGGNGACSDNEVVCNAVASCSIGCLDQDACKKVRALAQTVTVSCDGGNSCANGVFVTAGDASVGCTSSASNTCKDGVFCDGGKCTETCAAALSPLKFCCKSPTTCVDAGACSVTSAGCP